MELADKAFFDSPEKRLKMPICTDPSDEEEDDDDEDDEEEEMEVKTKKGCSLSEVYIQQSERLISWFGLNTNNFPN